MFPFVDHPDLLLEPSLHDFAIVVANFLEAAQTLLELREPPETLGVLLISLLALGLSTVAQQTFGHVFPVGNGEAQMLASSLLLNTDQTHAPDETYIFTTEGQHRLVVASHLQKYVPRCTDASTRAQVAVLPLNSDHRVCRIQVGVGCHHRRCTKTIMKP